MRKSAGIALGKRGVKDAQTQLGATRCIKSKTKPSEGGGNALTLAGSADDIGI